MKEFIARHCVKPTCGAIFAGDALRGHIDGHTAYIVEAGARSVRTAILANGACRNDDGPQDPAPDGSRRPRARTMVVGARVAPAERAVLFCSCRVTQERKPR
ncbi:hypothetical protein Y023_4830 [Burkholderia pseudomallei A79D]|nr:hypothetical protein Y023_4830 [Burkholderia pseudomallei A79D]KGX98024.1 hypothetical protein X997_4545 [Burkholderia pseudomallei A79C]